MLLCLYDRDIINNKKNNGAVSVKRMKNDEVTEGSVVFTKYAFVIYDC